MLSCEATNKTTRGARAGLSLTCPPSNVVCDRSAAGNAGIHRLNLSSTVDSSPFYACGKLSLLPDALTN